MESKYLFIITLLFFIQPDWSELECENVLEYKGRVRYCEKCGHEIAMGVSNGFKYTDEFNTNRHSTKELQVTYSIIVLIIVLNHLK